MRSVVRTMSYPIKRGTAHNESRQPPEREARALLCPQLRTARSSTCNFITARRDQLRWSGDDDNGDSWSATARAAYTNNIVSDELGRRRPKLGDGATHSTVTVPRTMVTSRQPRRAGDEQQSVLVCKGTYRGRPFAARERH